MLTLKLYLVNLMRTSASIYRSSLKFRAGLILFLILILFALISLFAPPGFERWFKYPKDAPPSFSSLDLLLGTTTTGRSVFWSATSAVANSLLIGFTTALIAAHIGLLTGIVAGYKGGLIEKLLMTLTDIFIVTPPLPLQVVLVMLLKNYINMFLIALILSISSWPWPARQVRGIMLSLREREFIITASFSGLTEWEIVFREILPHVLGWHLVNFTNTVLYAIGSEAGLAILGLSILHKDTLGTMIYWSVIGYPSLFRGIWWWFLTPVILIILIMISLYLISIGIAEYIEPRKKTKGVA